MSQKIKHVGINADRISREPEETEFAKAWKAIAPENLGYLLCGQDKRDHNYSQRDAEVAATVIQWIGSQVGHDFVDAVREKHQSRKK
jgi:hypothetical protein